MITSNAAEETGLSTNTKVICGGGDGCCAAVGSGVVKEGVANCCLGTSSWISLVSKSPIYSTNMETFNFAHIVPGYILPCGTMQTGGGALGWAVETIYGNDCEKNQIYQIMQNEVKNAVPGANKLVFLPYLIGERSPRWNNKAKGTFLGLTIGHSRSDIMRSVMEEVGYNLDVILNSFKSCGAGIEELIMIGGGARNKIWQKILCDIFGIPVKVPDYLEEATSMGAAVTAGVGAGIFEDFNAIEKFIKIKEANIPDRGNKKIYSEMKKIFNDAYYALELIFEEL